MKYTRFKITIWVCFVFINVCLFLSQPAIARRIRGNVTEVTNEICIKNFENITQNSELQKLLSELQGRGDNIAFTNDISDFSVRVGNTIYFNSNLFDNNVLSVLSLSSNKTLQRIILSQLKRHLITKSSYNSKAEELTYEVVGTAVEVHSLLVSGFGTNIVSKWGFLDLKARRNINAVLKFINALGITEGRMIEKVDLAKEITRIHEEDYYGPISDGLGYEGLNLDAIVEIMQTHLEQWEGIQANYEELLPAIGYVLLSNEKMTGVHIIYNFGMDSIEPDAYRNRMLSYREMFSSTEDGFAMSLVNDMIHRVLGWGLTSTTGNTSLSWSIKLAGFLLETEIDSLLAENFIKEYLDTIEESFLGMVFPFVENLLEEAERENADLVFMYRGSWALKEIAERIAEAKGLDMEGRIRELYFTTTIESNSSHEEQMRYFFEQGLFDSKVILVDTGFKGTLLRHVAQLMSDEELVAKVNAEYSFAIEPVNIDDLLLRLFYCSDSGNLDIYKEEYNFSAAYSGRILEVGQVVYTLDDRLEFDYLSPMHLESRNGRLEPILEETYLSRLRDLSREWLDELIARYIAEQVSP